MLTEAIRALDLSNVTASTSVLVLCTIKPLDDKASSAPPGKRAIVHRRGGSIIGGLATESPPSSPRTGQPPWSAWASMTIQTVGLIVNG
jgi:hypothetical protein